MRAYLLVGFLTVASACTGTEVGNPVDVDVTLYNEEFDPQPGAAAGYRRGGAGAGLVVIDRAWVALDRVRLRRADDCEGGARSEFEGPFFVDLLAPGPIPALRGLDIPGSEYCRFEMKWNAFDVDLPAGVPAELEKTSFFVAGHRADGVPFVLRSGRDDELRLDAVAGAFLVDEATAALMVAFDGARLFAGVDLDAAVVSGGVVYIDGESNELLLQVFDDNLRDAADLFRDEDGDGVLDPDERDQALAQ